MKKIDKCHLNSSIECEYSTTCKTHTNNIISLKKVIYFSKLISLCDSEDITVAKNLIESGSKDAFLKMWEYPSFWSVSLCKKNMEQDFEWFNFKIVYSSEYWFGLFIFLSSYEKRLFSVRKSRLQFCTFL